MPIEWRICTPEEEAEYARRCRSQRRGWNCEFPPDHVTGRATTPRHEPHHFGRDEYGRWRAWPMTDWRLAMFRRKVRSKPLVQLSVSFINACLREGREMAKRIAQYVE